jgi:hypothetical protein
MRHQSYAPFVTCSARTADELELFAQTRDVLK